MYGVVVIVLLGVASSVLSTPIERRAADICGYESCTLPEEGVLNVHIVPHTHDDVGWLKTVDQYYYGSRNNIQKAGVQYILDSVVKELWEDPKRRFIYVETAFFWKWWTEQTDSVKEKVHALVRQGRLQFVGGAWSMNDEAAAHYQSIMDQFTWGLRKLNDTFGRCGRPRVGWQIDPFGHAREFASLLAGMRYDGLFLGRIDYQDKRARLRDRAMEVLWRGDDDLGAPSDIFTGVLYNTYSPPSGFCFDVLCSDEPIIDDVSSPMYNVDRRVGEFVNYVTTQREAYTTGNVIITMGGDFTYQDATMWYKNLDKLIRYTNLAAAKNGTKLKLFYSTPDCYLNAVRLARPKLPIKQDDFFPYASDSTAYWTGYFTSRPTTKWFEREANDYLQMAKQLQVLAGLEEHNQFVLDELKSALGVMQHHDAITGTEKQHVAHDYERIVDGAIDDSLLIARQAVNKWAQTVEGAPPLPLDRCHLNQSECATSEQSDKFIVTIYNPLAWKLDVTPVRIPVSLPDEREYTITAPNGDAILFQLVELPDAVRNIPTRKSTATGELVFLAYNIKPLGYKSFYVQLSPKLAKNDPDNNRLKRKVRRDVEPNLVHTDIDDGRSLEENLHDKYTGGNTYEFYSRMSNNYWQAVKEQPYIDVVDVDHVHDSDIFVQQRAPIFNREPSAPVKKVSVNSDNDRYRAATFDVLKDRKGEENPALEQLKQYNKEAQPSANRKQAEPVEREESRRWLPSLNEDEMRMLGDDPSVHVVERSPEDDVLENQNMKLHVNRETNQITLLTLSDGTELPFDLKLLYYPGCSGNNSAPSFRSSGAYIFRPNATAPYDIAPNSSAKLIKGDVVDEMQFTLTDYVTYSIRIYKHEKINYIENEWLIGSIPVDDSVGKEIVVRYTSTIVNNGEFYTDSNGRQMLKRRLNQRPQWNLTLEEPIAGNYYPVTNKISIQDDEHRMTVLTDRSQGGSSLREGDVELMLHRRLLHDDAFGVDEALDETMENQGLHVKGKHRILVAKTTDANATIEERKKVFEMHLQPLVFLSKADNIDWAKLKNCHGALRTSLPDGVHLLTLEPFNEGKLLLRLENYLERSDTTSDVQVDISDIFATIKPVSLKETTLAGNEWLEDSRQWTWDTTEEFSKNFNRDYGSFAQTEQEMIEENRLSEEEGSSFNIKLTAKQIRTFVVDYELIM